MSRRLLTLNVLVGLLGCLFAAGLARELLTPLRLPPPSSPRAAQPARVAPPAAAPPAVAVSYGVVASRNLFSPSRSEGTAGPAVAVGPKPFLHGVVVNGPKSRAFLEDPVAKRTFAYSVGDTVAGGRVQSISGDRVIIARADGVLEVLLQDPAKPNPVPTTPAGAPGSAPAAPTGPGVPAPRRATGAAPEGERR
jgi:hypothetical protein